jgi:hypothetical protein
VIATITFQRAAPATSGTSPAAVLPCAVHTPGAAAGASPADDTCETGIITCDVIFGLKRPALHISFRCAPGHINSVQ